MAKLSGLKRGRALSRVAVAAIAAALVTTSTGAVAAENPDEALGAAAGAQERSGVQATGAASQGAVIQGLFGASGGTLYWYEPNGSGGYEAREWLTDDWGVFKNAAQTDNDADGVTDGMWHWDNGGALYFGGENTDFYRVGGGWNIYNRVFSPGNLGGASGYDLLARDSSGNLYLYLGYGDGKVTSRAKVGWGWNIYTQIAGLGDVTGDGKADVVARDKAGVLWLYQGTGNWKNPLSKRTKIGGGWNTYNSLVGVGDIDFDGVSDLVARDHQGALWRYSGTGSAAAPYKPRVKIGTGGWNAYRLMF
ncbi:FG-GAP repeat domain-containing protein [Streptomyces sp. PR69]|uniref:FG-GAP repeat domain-containing protein n=1 Tax=Streptomyces sp. PR69 TaxID=2984950 RepID=UPI002264F4A6|nr:VCBS repeat-containing protein [Streptomyces sp. PR69]